MNILYNCLKLIRVQNCLITTAAVLLGAHLTKTEPAYYRPLIASLAAFFVCAAGNTINDLLDIESDRINHPRRVLVTGELSLITARWLAVVMSGLAVALAILTGWLLLLILLAALVLLWYYNSRAKHLPLVGNSIVALLGSVLFIVGGMSVDNAAAFSLPGPIIPAVLAFHFHLLREVVKDVQDMRGDESVTSSTMAVLLGQKNSLRLALGIHLLTSAIILWPFLTGWYSGYYALIAVVGVVVPNSIVMVFLFRQPTHDRLAATARVLKLTMVIGVVSLLVA